MEIRVLGAVTARVAGQRVHIGGAKHRLMLAMLVAAEGRLVPTEILIDQIWDDHPPRTARELVYAFASDLRRYFEAGHPGAGGVLPRHRDGGYQLLAARDQVDLYRFRDLRARAGPLARQDDAQAAALLRQALSCWETGPGGEPGDGPFTDLNGTPAARCQWLQAYRHTLREERRAALIACLEAELRLGEHERLTAELANLAAADPLDERIAGLLLVAYYRSGRQGLATRAYQHIRQQLRADLGVEPGPHLRELYQRILSQDSRLDLPGPATPGGSAPPAAQATASRAASGHPQEASPLTSSEICLYRVAGRPGTPAKQVGIVCGDLRGVRCADVWVNSENTSMEMARVEEATVSSIIRYEGAVRDAAGRVIDDVIRNELARKLGPHVPVLPATVVTTGPGELRRSGVRRIVHVATVQGEPGAGYRQIRGIGRCVSNVLAEVDRITELPPGTTVLFPLLGVGSGGGELEPTIHSMLGAALDYFTVSPGTRIGVVFFLAYTDAELAACERLFAQNPRISAAGTGFAAPPVLRVADADDSRPGDPPIATARAAEPPVQLTRPA